MKRVLELALKGTGFVSPNPRVGCVIVKDGNVISEGRHMKFGEAHAEVNAINNANDEDLLGSELYVNLEPCSHTGKTPPCADLIIEKGIKKVIIGSTDPNPLVAGKGIEKLKNAGLEVVTGVMQSECDWINRFFFKHVTTGMPYVLLKVAQSINGMIAAATGQSKWITCDESRTRTHALRAECDAVLIGKRTASIDNPELTVRNFAGRNPYRIVLDTHLTLPLGIKNFTDDHRKHTIVCCSPESSVTRKAETLKAAGIGIVSVQLDKSGRLKIDEVLANVARDYPIASVMVEGGADVYSAFAEAGMIDEMHVFIAPMIIGNGLNAFKSFKINFLNEAPRLKIRTVSRSGTDMHMVLVRNDEE